MSTKKMYIYLQHLTFELECSLGESRVVKQAYMPYELNMNMGVVLLVLNVGLNRLLGWAWIHTILPRWIRACQRASNFPLFF